MSNPRVPPHDLQAERSVLGSMLCKPEMIDDVRPILSKPSNFYHFAHQLIFAAILALADRSGIASVDLVTLSQELTSQGKLAEAGGYAYLGGLYGDAPAAINAPHYAQTVKQLAQRRDLIHAAREIEREAFDPADPDTLLETCERLILAVREDSPSSVKTLVECSSLVLDRTDQVSHGREIGIKTGILDLDNLVLMKPEDLIILAARPSVGKTIFGAQVALHVALQQMAVLFCSVEMPGIDIAARIMSSLGEIDSSVTGGRRAPATPESEKLSDTFAQIGQLQFFVDDSSLQSVPIIAANARRLHRKHPLSLIVVDYVQLIQVDRQKGQTRAEVLGEVSRGLKRLARELQVPVLALAQLNRDAEGEPELHHIRESGDIEQDADMVWMLWRDKDENKQLIHLKVAKQRSGPTGSVNIFHRKEFMRFDHYLPGFQPHHQPLFGGTS